MTTPIGSQTGSPGDELRAYQAVIELGRRGITADLAYDENGRVTGRVALDPQAVLDLTGAEDDEENQG
ncbi:hypothetical protein Kfla_2187 [Kribbella flavida DSM 17836]|uniref:Uncharacterized protein n=1 Tax=Kribbella flavida (strain DSM 17836 / JCM 10339 / NBRC 14399) TaxID=479435 RepID=D2PTF3_KRIFD|nr:hypothetical protein [Kribbella flavida]ADB31266.1 hypothetical protein Kfla_2187 [Kribbella flavida DSM 17836]